MFNIPFEKRGARFGFGAVGFMTIRAYVNKQEIKSNTNFSLGTKIFFFNAVMFIDI